MDGLLLIDKPLGWTSFDVVAKVRGILRANGIKKPKVGHTGTLDPLASGLLILVLGTYCKRANEFTKLDKTYQVVAHLGQTSSTGDAEGQKTDVSTNQPTLKQIKAALDQFTGTIQQVPPQYSAIKVGGKRAYQLARQGKTVQLEPRSVTIYGFAEVNYQYPKLEFTVSVSSGTYVRSLVEDIGHGLGVGAYITGLRRLTVGNYDIKNAISVAELKDLPVESILTLDQ